MMLGFPLAYYRFRGVLLQEYFLREALNEVGVYGGKITINHMDGMSHHSSIGWVPLVFPMRLVNLLKDMEKTKNYDYYFKGVVTPSRSWIKKYTGVFESQTGRARSTKYFPDIDYYSMLSGTRFALCPTGDCPWSYRFFEAIMCKSIPVLGDREIDLYSDKFIIFRDSEDKVYNESWCDDNLSTFLKYHTLNSCNFT